MTELALAAALFLVVHLLPSTRLRPAAISAIGEPAYAAVFSLISLAGIIWLFMAFFAAPASAKLWDPSGLWVWIQAALIWFSFVLIGGGLAAPNPTLMGQSDALNREGAGTGIFAITRHPIMWGIGLWAFAHLISQANLRGLLFFGSLGLLAIGGSWLQEKRKSAEIGPAWAEFAARTSFVPFQAIIQGRNKIGLRGLPYRLLVAATLMWAAVLHAHLWLFGVSPGLFNL
jgi:uncharacterized membrane protein